MLLLFFALLSVALCDSACFPNPPFTSPDVVDDQLAISLIAEDFRLAVWDLPPTTDLQTYLDRLDALFSFEFRQVTLDAVAAAVDNRVEIMVNAKAGATDAQVLAFLLCMNIERAVIEAVGGAFIANVTASLAAIQWPTQEWIDIRAAAEESNDIVTILVKWIDYLVGQVINRIKIIGIYLLKVADDREAALLGAYDAIIGYANGTLTAQQMRVALNDFVMKLLNEHRVTLLIAYYQAQWNTEVAEWRQKLQEVRNGLRYYYRDFVRRFRAAVADGVSNLNAELKQALLDYLAGYGINSDADIQLTVSYTGTTDNATLTVSFTFNIPDFYLQVDAEAQGRHIQNLVVRWLVVHFGLDPNNAHVEPYVVPAKRASDDTMTVTLASQSGAGSVTAALFVFLLAFLFH